MKRLLLLLLFGAIAFAQQPVTVTTALPTGANTIGAVTQASGPWTMNLTQVAGGTLGATSNYGTSPGAVAVMGVNAFITNSPAVSFGPLSTSGGATSSFDVTAATATQVKATAGNVYGLYVYNPNTSPCFLQFYNNAAASLGTGAIHPLGVQAGVTLTFPPGSIAPMNFATAISTGQTTTATGSSTCASPMIASVFYQ